MKFIFIGASQIAWWICYKKHRNSELEKSPWWTKYWPDEFKASHWDYWSWNRRNGQVNIFIFCQLKFSPFSEFTYVTLHIFWINYVISISKICTYYSKLVLCPGLTMTVWGRSTRIGFFRFLFHIVEFSVFHYFRYQVRGCVIFAGSFISVMALGRPKDNYLRKSLFDNLVGIFTSFLVCILNLIPFLVQVF